MRTPAATALVISALSLGCGTPTGPTNPLGPASAGFLTTDATTYQATAFETVWDQPRYVFQVIATFHNRLAVPVYLGRCYPDTPHPIYGVEAVDAEGSRSGYDPAWACVGHDRPIEVAAGATRVDTLRIEGPTAFDGRTHEPIGRVVGRFRLVYDVWLGKDEGASRAPNLIRASNAFVVETGR